MQVQSYVRTEQGVNHQNRVTGEQRSNWLRDGK